MTAGKASRVTCIFSRMPSLWVWQGHVRLTCVGPCAGGWQHSASNSWRLSRERQRIEVACVSYGGAARHLRSWPVPHGTMAVLCLRSCLVAGHLCGAGNQAKAKHINVDSREEVLGHMSSKRRRMARGWHQNASGRGFAISVVRPHRTSVPLAHT